MTPEWKYPGWQEALPAVVREANPQLLRERLQKLEALMSARCRELEDELDALISARYREIEDELDALNAGCVTLVRNQRYR